MAKQRADPREWWLKTLRNTGSARAVANHCSIPMREAVRLARSPDGHAAIKAYAAETILHYRDRVEADEQIVEVAKQRVNELRNRLTRDLQRLSVAEIDLATKEITQALEHLKSMQTGGVVARRRLSEWEARWTERYQESPPRKGQDAQEASSPSAPR